MKNISFLATRFFALFLVLQGALNLQSMILFSKQNPSMDLRLFVLYSPIFMFVIGLIFWFFAKKISLFVCRPLSDQKMEAEVNLISLIETSFLAMGLYLFCTGIEFIVHNAVNIHINAENFKALNGVGAEVSSNNLTYLSGVIRTLFGAIILLRAKGFTNIILKLRGDRV